MGDVPSSPAGIPAGLVAAATRLFGDKLDTAKAYAELLAGPAVERGLIGPREAPRLWERHLLNCAALSELMPDATSLADVGSGAGLPGVVLAIARPDCTVTLIEPLARRTAFLSEVIETLGLRNVQVVRGRAEEQRGRLAFPVVTCRAVASLDKLALWCLPLVVPGGRLLALKGASAATEVRVHQSAVTRSGGGNVSVLRCGTDVLPEPTTVVQVVAGRNTIKMGKVR
jgi:16S rRNA (guanine527-N7)-methyltransferase